MNQRSLGGSPMTRRKPEKRRAASRQGDSPPSQRPALGGPITMQIESIKQTDLTQSEREVLKEDGERWKRIGGGSHLDEWLSFLPGLMIRRTLAMRIAHTNQPIGKLYSD